MKFSFSGEQEEFRSNLRRLLADRSPTKEVRRLMETDQGYERDSWRAINTALGLTAIRIPEGYGGYGFSFGDQCIVLEEMGRALLCAPYFATAVLAAAVMNAGTEAEKEALLPGIAAGATIRPGLPATYRPWRRPPWLPPTVSACQQPLRPACPSGQPARGRPGTTLSPSRRHSERRFTQPERLGSCCSRRP